MSITIVPEFGIIGTLFHIGTALLCPAHWNGVLISWPVNYLYVCAYIWELHDEESLRYQFS